MTPAWALPLLIVMQTRSASVSPRPVAWAAQSPRPATCLVVPGLWEVSRRDVIERHCRELARAQALLIRAPEQALARATALAAEAPALAEARVLRGRASLRAGKAEQALLDLAPLVADGAPAVADPGALLDGGRAALSRGDLPLAARFYRELGSRAALLADRTQQVVAYIEIAAALLAGDAAPPDDVVAYLREARRRSAGTGYTGLVAALTAVTWVAHGREAEGQGALAELSDPFALSRFESAKDVWLPAGLHHAVMGLALERQKSDLSQSHYRALSESVLATKPVGRLGARAPGGKRGAR